MTATKIQVFSSTERNQNRNWQLRLKLHFGNFSRLAIIDGLTNHDARKTASDASACCTREAQILSEVARISSFRHCCYTHFA